LNQKQIQHIANLARLELTEEELKKYSNQLSDILSYINQLKEADTTNVEPTAQVTGMENIFREDTVEEWDKDEIEVALEQAGELEDGQVKVGRVLA
ncbi:Asp-tRNA(Asn)/Glu-tRNA(Gln) amidotransferase subunit GatC, partial [Patescibacteria group bacterium]|nr:Asp-tRNA(Asn)/Glu-tRNA(Gln) amidotransferase subunit GatC [Patescibacteria group bacterium]MBU1160830.1 Asp-tRNA(Asn)/Glu-tRNA(Gln) amidotransferase subunit GatC [Patescibacteria group bacterium]